MSTRRNFFKYLGLGAGVAAGGVVAAAAVLPDTEKEKAIQEIKAAGFNGRLTLGSEYGVQHHTPGQVFAQYQFVPSNRQNVKVTFAVGPDGNLYLNQNGKWAKIVTE